MHHEATCLARRPLHPLGAADRAILRARTRRIWRPNLGRTGTALVRILRIVVGEAVHMPMRMRVNPLPDDRRPR